MEERILDKEESRGIRLKRTADGGTDAVDALAEGEEGAEEELFVELPEEEYDEDLVGLTPSQLKEALEKREKLKREAREESERLTKEGSEKLAEEKFADAELLFGQALVCDGENDAAREGLWTARTRGFSDADALFADGAAEELARDGEARELVQQKMGETMQTLWDSYQKEEQTLAPGFEAKQAERRTAFAANRKYYLIRFAAFLLAAAAMAVGIIVSASFILRTKSNTPVILAGVFGGLTFIALCVSLFFAHKLYVAARFCRENERLASTETGARIAFLRERLYALGLILGKEEETEGENGETGGEEKGTGFDSER